MTELYEALGEMKKTNGNTVNRMHSNIDASPRAAIPARSYPDKPKRKSFKLKTAETIMATEYPPIIEVVKGYLPVGLNVLAARQKMGKSFLSLDWSVSVVTGQCAMGQVPCEQGDVLIIDMENGERRVQDRLNILYPDGKSRPDLSRLYMTSDAIPLDQGLIECMETWRRSVERPLMVVIDVLQRIKPCGKASRNAYENDYAIFSELQTWAIENRIAVVGLHHTKKGGADDPLEALSGSNGLSAVADTTLVLDKDANGTSLYIRGRDIEEKKIALQFEGGLWSVLGNASEVFPKDERTQILALLEEADVPLGPSDIASMTGIKHGKVRKLLTITMANAGEVLRVGYGKYIHPDNGHLLKEKKAQTVPAVTGRNTSGNTSENSSSDEINEVQNTWNTGTLQHKNNKITNSINMLDGNKSVPPTVPPTVPGNTSEGNSHNE